MNPGTIWWSQIGNSLRLLNTVSNTLRDCVSAVVQVPANFPWRYDFYEAVDIRRASFSSSRRLRRLPWTEKADPGKFVLNELCPEDVVAYYWPGKSYAAYLGMQQGIMLNDYDVWITGVHTKADLVRWAEFIREYEKETDTLESRAVFVIEYDGEPVDSIAVEQICYSVERYDCRVFALEAAAALDNAPLRSYQAELALSISGGDPQICAMLLETGEQLLADPIRMAKLVIHGTTAVEEAAEQRIQSAVWEASVVLLFPILERCRLDFIAANRQALARHLPINNSNGERVTEPCDLELGTLHHITGAAPRDFEAAALERIRLCRNVRNQLAHNKPLAYADVAKVLTMTK